MKNIEVIEDAKLKLFNVLIDGEKMGVFDNVTGDKFRFFSRKEDKLIGDNYIAIGNALNKINEDV